MKYSNNKISFISHYACLILCIIFCTNAATVRGQLTLFNGLKSNKQLAKRFEQRGEYQELLKLYELMAKNKKNQPDIFLKLAQVNMILNKPEGAIKYYEKYKIVKSLDAKDELKVARLYQQIGNKKKALELLQKYTLKYPEDAQGSLYYFTLRNQKYIYEDSTYFRIRPLSINSSKSDFSPSLSSKALYFSSQRDNYSVIKILDSFTGYNRSVLYKANYSIDTLDINQKWHFEKPTKEKSLSVEGKGFWKIQLYDEGKSAIVTKSFIVAREKPSIGIFFTNIVPKENLKEGIMTPFQYNSTKYAIIDPTISEDGNTLYFSSDMEGTMGGYDIFVTKRKEDNTWTLPQNLGTEVNSVQNEITPYLFRDNELFFSSNGHGGLGGYDVFTARLYEGYTNTPRNMGYPINSTKNDSNFIVTNQGQLGFFNSNRKNGGFDEDIYQVNIDLQVYPLEIECELNINLAQVEKNKRNEWIKNTLEEGVQVELIDGFSKTLLNTTQVDKKGFFKLMIPYANYFILKIIMRKKIKSLVTLEFPIIKREQGLHQITITPNLEQLSL